MSILKKQLFHSTILAFQDPASQELNDPTDITNTYTTTMQIHSILAHREQFCFDLITVTTQTTQCICNASKTKRNAYIFRSCTNVVVKNLANFSQFCRFLHIIGRQHEYVLVLKPIKPCRIITISLRLFQQSRKVFLALAAIELPYYPKQ